MPDWSKHSDLEAAEAEFDEALPGALDVRTPNHKARLRTMEAAGERLREVLRKSTAADVAASLTNLLKGYREIAGEYAPLTPQQRGARATNSGYTQSRQAALEMAVGLWAKEPIIRTGGMVKRIHEAFVAGYLPKAVRKGREIVPSKKSIRDWIVKVAPPEAGRSGRECKHD